MLIARSVLPAASWDRNSAADSVSLDYDNRQRRRFRLTTQGGLSFLLDLPRVTPMQDGDGLQLDDGRIIAVVAADEALMHVVAGPHLSLPRLAWHVGNRHLAAQIGADWIRLRADHVIEQMLIGLGASVTAISAPFSPESGAYAQGSHGHGHGHHQEHDDDDDHHHHHHSHDHAHG